MSILFGLTGGIGSGKSTAASYFKELGAIIIDADEISRKLVKPGRVAWNEIKEEFGAHYINPDKSLNREKIAVEVFQDNKKRRLLESIIHPRVLVEEQKLYQSYKNSNPEAVVIIDSALMIESKNYKNVDKVILLTCSEDLQIRRVMDRSGESKKIVINRIKAQMSLEKKLKYADHVLNNNGTKGELQAQINKLYKNL